MTTSELNSVALPADTLPEAMRVQLAALRRIGIAGRARMAFELSDAVRATVASGLRHRHPEYTAAQVGAAVSRLTIGGMPPGIPGPDMAGSFIEQKAFLANLVEQLEKAGIAYMVSGSLGSSFHGQPRATNDIDFVIAPTGDQSNMLLESLSRERYYVSRAAAQQALRDHSMFNVIDPQTGWKADFVIRKDRPFSLEEFGRRQTVRLMDLDVAVVSPEDAILSKLEWAKDSRSPLQLGDALGVVAAQGDCLDVAYLRRWAAELGVSEELGRVLEEAERLRA